MLMGSEKSEDFARNSLPSNRWELFWDIFKGSFGKLIIANLLILLFFLPLLLLLYFRSNVVSSFSFLYPFAQGFGVGYQAPVTMNVYSEYINLSSNLVSFLFMPLVMMVGAIGLSGGAYLLRNMVWTEGVFVSNDFWKGIKQNYKQIVVISLLYSLVFYVTIATASISSYSISFGAGVKWLSYVCEAISYVILVYYTIMTLFMISMSVTYDIPVLKIIRNSFYFTLAFLPHSIVMLVLAGIPFILLALSATSSMFLLLVLLLILVIGFSFTLLVWMNFSQWTFDNFINDKVPGAKKNRGMYQKVNRQTNEKTKLQYKAQYGLKNSLNSRPIKPITDEEIEIATLPQSFNREDIIKLKESKQNMIEDHKRYVEEHINDEQFKMTEEEKNKEAAEKERLKKIEQAKKALRKHEKYNK